MGRIRIAFLAVALACLASLSVAQDEPQDDREVKEANEQPVGEYELQSDKLSGKVSFFTQGDYVGAEFQIKGPLQPDDKSAELNVLVSREDDAYQFVYNPTRADVRRAVKTRVSNVWKDDPAGNDRHAGTVVSQTEGGWSAIVWIDAEAIGGSTQETWTLGAGVTADGETASHPKSGDALPKVDLTELEERDAEEDHPAELALKAERRVLSALTKSRNAESIDGGYKVLVAALKENPADPSLWVSAMDAMESVGSISKTYRVAGMPTLLEACESAIQAFPGWLHVHAIAIEERLFGIQPPDPADAAAYFLKWRDRLPRMQTAGWKEFIAIGLRALAADRDWKQLERTLGLLTNEDFGPFGMQLAIQFVAESALGAGQDELAIRLRDRLLECDDDGISTASLRVWWLHTLSEYGRFAAVLEQARELLGVKGIMEDQRLRGDYVSACIHAIGGLYDPPEASAECANLIKEGEGQFTEEMVGDLNKYAETCNEADKDWQAELGYRKEDAAKQNPRVRVQSDQGEFVIELFEDDAPNTVANFVKLTQDGFYEGRKIYRRESGWLVQGGGRDDSPDGKTEDWSIQNEANKRQHWRGTIAMARMMDKESGNTHFFITIGNTSGSLKLGTDWVVFGRIVEGLENTQRLQIGDKITKATAEDLRDHEYKPERIPVKKEPEQK